MKILKKLKIIHIVFILSSLGFAESLQGQTKDEIKKIIKDYDFKNFKTLMEKYENREIKLKKRALKLAKQKGWKTKIQGKDGSFIELQRVEGDKPIYFTTFNIEAAKSTRTNHLQTGGSLGLNLMGQGMTVHIWDGKLARSTHQEYDGLGGNNRYSIGDESTDLHYHSAHVTGTIIASGVQAKAKGMAPHAKAIGYDWSNDFVEACNAAMNGMLLSNHSYGQRFRSPETNEVLPQYYFGGYIDQSSNWDNLMFLAPNYLMIAAAGNHGNDDTANETPTGGHGWDKLTGRATCKNNLVVANAKDANINESSNLVSVEINSSSSEGPTDDFRIKPDITGNGTGVYSTYESSDTAYKSISGTSMAAPNVTGSLLLLQQYYNTTQGSYMKAATLKGLALHTADDAGTSGPDAVFGWGLLNAKKAAETITEKERGLSKIDESTLTSGKSNTIRVNSDGKNPLMVSISWTDRPGEANELVNSTTPVLVNDLDVRVIDKNNNISFPYKLITPTTSAKQDNNVDPYERVDILNASGTYEIVVSHKGTLVGDKQNYSLIVTGILPNCISKGKTSSYEWIDFVSFSDMENTSGNNGGYVDFTNHENKMVNITSGKTYEINVRAGFSNAPYQEHFTVWIDYNQNGVFEDEEKNYIGSINTTDSLTKIITVPPTTKSGKTRMRVSMKYDSEPSSCEIFNYGEVEDYTVNVENNTSETPLQAPSGLTTTLVTSSSISLVWDAPNDPSIVSYEIYKNDVLEFTTENNSTTTNIEGLTPDTLYTFFIKAKNNTGQTSEPSNTINVHTESDTSGSNCDGIEEYVYGTVYSQGQLVIYNDNKYECTQTAYYIYPTDSNYWKDLGSCTNNSEASVRYTSSTSEVSEKTLFSMYPNPIYQGSKLTLLLDKEPTDNIEVRITDLTGKIVVSKQFNTTKTNILNHVLTLDTPKLKPGIYLVHTNNDVKKLIVK